MILILATAVSPAPAAVVTRIADRDATLIQDPNGSLASGAGAHLFAGRTSTGSLRRGILRFDLSPVVPPGSIVISVSLRLHLSQNAGGAGPISLHRASVSWGEGASAATGGGGAPAQPQDATWLHRFFDVSFWSTPGGDFEAAASGLIEVDAAGPYTWSTATMRDDVQAWVDDPAGNHGWLLLGDEVALQTAKRFDSRENPNTAVRPALQVEFVPPAGRVPDGHALPGPPLTLVPLPGGGVLLTWGASCAATDEDYAVYEGPLPGGAFQGHTPRICSTGGATAWTLSPSTDAHYYLIVPHNGAREGSYGVDAAGRERAASTTPCLPALPSRCP